MPNEARIALRKREKHLHNRELDDENPLDGVFDKGI
jgi:hypothetical protein